MKLTLDDYAAVLDDVVKAASKSSGRKTFEDFEEEIGKSLTFNPLAPTEMTPEVVAREGIYSPYAQAPEGGFVPHTAEHWMGMGKDPDDYRNVHQIYEEAGAKQPSLDSLRHMFVQAIEDTDRAGRSFSFLSRSIKPTECEMIVKGIPMPSKGGGMKDMGMPVGTIHRFSDGKQYRKEAPGKWVPVSAGAKPGGKEDATQSGHVEIERHAMITRIRQEMDRRTKAAADQKQLEGRMKQTAKKYATKQTEAAGIKSPVDQLPKDKDKPGNFDLLEGADAAKKIYFIEGSKVKMDHVQQFLKEFSQDFKDIDSNGQNSKFREDMMSNGALYYTSRLKGPDSLLKKMQSKYLDRSLNTVTDAIGARALAGSLEDQKRLFTFFKSQHELVEEEDFAEQGRPDGYRAIHCLFRTSSGKIGEFQFKTINQQLYSGYFHDTVYKGSKAIQDDPEVAKFQRDVSDYLHRLDSGQEQFDINRAPKAPKQLVAAKYKDEKGKEQTAGEFPWENVRTKNVGDYLYKADDESQSVKYFLVLRDKKGNTVGTKSYNSLEAAQKEQTRLLNQKNYGDLPIAQATSEKELFATFHEYRPRVGSQVDDQSKDKSPAKYTRGSKTTPQKRKFGRDQNGSR